MNWYRNRYTLVFGTFLLSIVLVFLYARPLDSPWQRMIGGDGLGYYSYLPAKYIYNDSQYDFKWFNGAYDSNYVKGGFPNPEDNFLVAYGNRKINKYYQGLSYVWLPFFALGHVCAKAQGYPPDGFSLPYQLAIGLASLVYLFLGLIYLRRLLQKLFHSPFVSTIVPILIFYGSHLFFYAIHFNSLSHVYSFCFLTLFIYFLVSYFNDKDRRLRNLMFCLLWLIISICIRPLNGLVILLIPAFIPIGFFKERLRFEKLKFRDILILLLVLGAIINQVTINHTQTGSFVPYTYSGERFYFDRSIFFDALFSYRIGLFVYVPLFIVSLAGIPYLVRRQRFILPLFFFVLIFIYSSWWYWPIVKRALVDLYFIPAIFLGALLSRFNTRFKRTLLLSICIFAALYFQLKNYQLTHGILDEYNTYKEVFWRNFLRTKKASMFLVPPSSIMQQYSQVQDFETGSLDGVRTTENKHSGSYALLLDSKNYIGKISENQYPTLFNEKGTKKIRLSFWSYFEKNARQLHVFLRFLDAQGKTLHEAPFYINSDSVESGVWDYREFGLDLVDTGLDGPAAKKVDKIVLIFWNVEAKARIFTDDINIEYMLTDNSYETIK